VPRYGARGGEGVYRSALPQLSDDLFLTDSGLETDLVFNGGFDLPEFAAFVLLDDAGGTAALDSYYRRHLDIAVQHGCGAILETPTWRANRDWGAAIGYSPTELGRVNQSAVDLLSQIRRDYQELLMAPVVISGCIGPRADAYRPTECMSDAEAEDYHREQIATFAASDIDMVHAMTVTYPSEAIGIVRAAGGVNVPVAISFTTETDGRLPDGTPLAEALTAVETATDSAPAYYGVNCAHPTHFETALPHDAVGARVRSIRANASRKSHAELDESPTLDDGDRAELAADYVRLRCQHASLSIVGGCCGTDARHIQAVVTACMAETRAE
jgi:homocysteine S-methyltransferase